MSLPPALIRAALLVVAAVAPPAGLMLALRGQGGTGLEMGVYALLAGTLISVALLALTADHGVPAAWRYAVSTTLAANVVAVVGLLATLGAGA